jgi:RNA polymerase-binding transcription factor DksA
MTKSELSGFAKRLREMGRQIDVERSQLKHEALRPAGAETAGSPADVPNDSADLASHASEESRTLATLANEEMMTEEINSALARIDQGTFGICAKCSCAIPKVRLEALPYARCCIACAQKIEANLTR